MDSGSVGGRAHEYGVKAWGGYFQTPAAQERGHRAGAYFFPTMEERDAFRQDLLKVADLNGIVTSCWDGPDARDRTIACMTLVVAGREYPLEYDFGFGYDAAGARYMFLDGNYSCDCNLSLMLQRIYGDVPGLPAPDPGDQDWDGLQVSACGDEIDIRDFQVRREVGPPGDFLEDHIGARKPVQP